MSTIAHLSASDRALALEALAKKYREACNLLEERVQNLENEVADAHRRCFPGIKRALAKATEAKDTLATEIDRNRDLFDNPRTVTLHGTRYGLAKGKGGLEWDDDDEVIVARIEKLHPDQLDTLLIVKKSPSKTGLQELDAKSLKRLGISVAEAGDAVFIKSTDGDATKMVKRLLKESTGRIPEGES